YLQDIRQELTELQDRARTFGGNKRFTLGNFVREKSKEAHKIAFYYRMTQDESYIELARSIIIMLCSEDRWLYQDGSSRRSDLWTGDIGVNVSITYNSIREALSAEDRALIEESLYRKAFLPLYED